MKLEKYKDFTFVVTPINKKCLGVKQAVGSAKQQCKKVEKIPNSYTNEYRQSKLFPIGNYSVLTTIFEVISLLFR
jgi:hypothetical protein